MESFDKREEGFERAFSHAEELRFRARARRNRKLGRWAGEKLGLTGAALDGYAEGLVAHAVVQGDDEALIAELAARLAPAEISEHRIRRRFDEFEAEAERELQTGR